MSQFCRYCQKVVGDRACQSATEEDDCKQRQRRGQSAGQDPQIFTDLPLARHEILRELRQAHSGHRGMFQGGNFWGCQRCRVHVSFRGETLTWTPPRARRERELRTLADVRATVRQS